MGLTFLHSKYSKTTSNSFVTCVILLFEITLKYYLEEQNMQHTTGTKEQSKRCK